MGNVSRLTADNRMIMNRLDPGGEPTANDIQMMEDIHEELKDFAVQVRNGVA